MRYAITGHTQGIGKKLYQTLCPNIQGFSRSNNFDINNNSDRQKILASLANCDTFINNACSDFGQIKLLIDLSRMWENDNKKTIINIGSKIAEIDFLPDNRLDLLEYQVQKKALKNTVLLLEQNVKCKIIYIWFGYVGTEKILSKYPNLKTHEYITEEQAVQNILTLISK